MFFNFINEDDLRVCAARLVQRLDESVRARCARLIRGALREDPRNARPAANAEIENAPDWARRAHRAGAALSRFVVHPASRAHMRRIVARIAEAYADLQSIAPDARGEASLLRAECQRLFDNIEHMNILDIDIKARAASRRRRALQRAASIAAARAFEHFQREFIPAGGGRRWRRVVSTGDLGQVGKRMRNCTAHDRGTHNHYARALARDEAQFWVLETHANEPLIMAMICGASGTVLTALGPRNEDIPSRSPDLAVLLRTKSFHRRPLRPRVRARPHARDEEVVLMRRLHSILERVRADAARETSDKR